MMKQLAPGVKRWRQTLLSNPRFEVLPVAGALERVTRLPAGATVTVTASPRRGIEDTIAFTETLAARGYAAVPHLAARQFSDETQLTNALRRLHDAGVDDLFVVGGDASASDGAFPDGLALLKAIDASGYRFGRIGVPSYPEGHPQIDDDTLWEALRAKRPYATYTVTQLCFDSDAIGRFAASTRMHGFDLPIVVGVPGVVAPAKLLRMSLRVGVGDSLRFVRGNRSMARRLLTPRAYRPDGIVRGLAGQMAEGRVTLAGLHIYTFNETSATVRWLEQRLGHAADEDIPAHVYKDVHEKRPADDHAV
ncbi:methylenetetrahydrofolate reductase [Actinobacteria bacterium YIM 96077]|uniref:Methylenetetrahydrofolate reductase n=1 Tax=Phytoactinopolyspora halophila TaxID=1981511 RepID=A0A329QZ11_9ACTN|nr:methylenetetrahydrofolate reductase [Phytoactinopolyspora halophila]AYY13391.1 methylenetetrahydrofolate reductase [Actinobacteria bacterium YIM 96077]RAW17373.1 methylenetetrahydrofolate reductase [Phytoactinopolyspora halophila]